METNETTIDISSVTIDHSLVFNVSDGSAISIIAPVEISESYTLKLPGKKPLNNSLIFSDENGNLRFDRFDMNSFKSNFLEHQYNFNANYTNFEDMTPTTAYIQMFENIMREIFKDKINYGTQINYFMPITTFNSNRGTVPLPNNRLVNYTNFDKKEFICNESLYGYLNGQYFLHAININLNNFITYGAIDKIIINYLDSILGSKNKILINNLSNEYYLRVLNLSTMCLNNGNKNLRLLNSNFYDNLKQVSRSYPNINFNEIPNILDQLNNPPYYFDISGQNYTDPNREIIVKLNQTIKSELNSDISINELLIYGNIEYEQNFIAIKNALNSYYTDPAHINVIMYFYVQNTNGDNNSFDNNISIENNYINKTMNNFILDFSSGMIYDYGNIMFALDNSFCNSIGIPDASLTNIVIPNLNYLNNLYDTHNHLNNYIYFNNNSRVEISSSPSSSSNIDDPETLGPSNFIYNFSDNTDVSFRRVDRLYIEDFSFIKCNNNDNKLSTIKLSEIQESVNDAYAYDKKNLLIICPIIDPGFILGYSSFENIPSTNSTQDLSFNRSLYRYLPLINYFRTCADDTINTSQSYNLSIIISTNQTDTTNKLLASVESGLLAPTGDFTVSSTNTSSIINSGFRKVNLILTKYDKFNISYYDGINLINNSRTTGFTFSMLTSNMFNTDFRIMDNNSQLDTILTSIAFNFDSLDNINNSNISDRNNIDPATCYYSIENSIYFLAIYLLYLKYQENYINVILQVDALNNKYSIYNYYKDLISYYKGDNTNINKVADISNIKLMEDIFNKKIFIKPEVISKLKNKDFSFYSIQSSDITLTNDAHFGSFDNISELSIWDDTIHIILLLTNNYSNTANSYPKFNLDLESTNIKCVIAEKYNLNNSTIQSVTSADNIQQIFIPNYTFYNILTSLPTPPQLSKSNRYDLLKKWQYTYINAYQYLSLNF